MRISNILLLAGCSLLAQSNAMSWDQADKKAKKFMSDLTIEEKINIVTGANNMQNVCVGEILPIPRKNFKGLCLQDGPAGVRFNNGTSTTWPVGMNSATTFNKKLLYDIGKGQGEEYYDKGINVALAPAMNLMRAPAAGRIWESYGEDQFLSGVCGAQVTKGMQDAGIIATAKHYVGNDQEYNRESSSSNIDERTLMEVYLEPFIMTINGGDAYSVMAGYNAVNGVYSVKNKEILTNILKDKLNYKGFIMSDWWAVHDIDSFTAGLDMNMPGGMYWGPDHVNDSFWGENIAKGIEDGSIDMERLDDATLRIIRAVYKSGQMDKYPEVNLNAKSMHIDTATQAAIESQVLLKNEKKILPINNKKVKKIAVIGKDAAKTKVCTDTACADGTVIQGWGSGTTDFPDDISVPIDEITKRAKKSNIKVIDSSNDEIEAAVAAAKEADVAVVFIQASSGELYITVEGNKGDRIDLDAWHNGNALVEAVAAVNKNVVVVIHAPGPINLPFLDKVKGVIYAGMPGQQAGIAISSVLFGDANPSGHLPFTWAPREDYCCDVKTGEPLPNGGPEMTQYDYDEGLFLGYKWFDKKGIVPTYAFGHGLSYTTFKYSGLSVKLNNEGGNVTDLKATFTVKNTGKVEGATVPMLFLSFPEVEELGEYPSRLLKGFEKINLKPGQSKKVTITVDQHALSYYNVDAGDFVVPAGGEYTVHIGQSADEVSLTKAVKNTQVGLNDDEDSEDVDIDIDNDEDSNDDE